MPRLLLFVLLVWALVQPGVADAGRGGRSRARAGGTKVSKGQRASHRRSDRRVETRQLQQALSKKRRSSISRHRAGWKTRRAHREGDSGLRDHARRHSSGSPARYLEQGQLNVARGRMLKGGGKYKDARYYVRRTGEGTYSMTITDRRNQILSIDTWKPETGPIRREHIERGLKASGVTPPKRFWSKLESDPIVAPAAADTAKKSQTRRP